MAPKRFTTAQRPGKTAGRPGTPRIESAGQGAKFLGVSVLSGFLLAGLALPAVGVLGVAAKNGAESFDNIPDDFKTPTLSQASFIYDSKGQQIAKVFDRDRTILTQDQMSPIMRQAQVDIEDNRFFEHGAIDPKGVARAISKNAESGSATQGASTLTQQYVKNVFVEQAGDDQAAFLEATRKSLGRKIQELKYAMKLEEELPKQQILTNYLNITFYGHQAYGVEAASNRYFGKSNKDLTVAEAATLAGLVQNPSAYDPMLHPAAARTRRDTVIAKMAEYRHITPQQAKDATATPLNLNYHEPLNGCITANAGMGFFCDYVRHVVKGDPVFGASAAERSKLWNDGGLRIYTTIDPDKQAAANKAVTTKVYTTDTVSAAMTMIKPGTGEILAMAQTRPYGLDATKHQTVVNLNADAAMGGGNGFQPGSTFKPILAAAALEAGTPLNQQYPAPAQMPYPAMSTCEGSWTNTGHDLVNNDSPTEVGPFGMPEAMARSVNTYFVQLEQDVGLCPMKQMANKLGIRTKASGAPLEEVPAMTLGVEEMSPLDMAGAYAAFASRGTFCSPVAISSVTGSDGRKLPVPEANCEQVMQQSTADSINTLLNGVTEKGTGSALGLDDGRMIAGKTGTTDERRAAWFDGYTPDLVGVVWLGGPEGGVKMDGSIKIGGRSFADNNGVYGSTGPGPAWQEAMSEALAGTPKSTFQLVTLPSPTAAASSAPGSAGSPGSPGSPAPNPGQSQAPNTPAAPPPGPNTPAPAPARATGGGIGGGGSLPPIPGGGIGGAIGGGAPPGKPSWPAAHH
ncbi:membrane peptidoglycan carboxypeptidase [Kitasatospora sp. MAA4]|uniref:transglycosylase domain-containing protein n=1 Tax=Kitasatospora sp. MAA4 TaxID=3035093 RepID=UPI0024744A28|nr:transglycosylase domain-containing protein [Kitasatospora sp. MAA4]MDH6132679.1 membrane peptidoglycan carboxypeptidase [Kitasatospora sp. MAA4]